MWKRKKVTSKVDRSTNISPTGLGQARETGTAGLGKDEKAGSEAQSGSRQGGCWVAGELAPKVGSHILYLGQSKTATVRRVGE